MKYKNALFVALLALAPNAIGDSYFRTSIPDPAVTPFSLSPELAPKPENLIKAADIAAAIGSRGLPLRSQVAVVYDDREGVPLYDRNGDRPRAIASLTKLMTAVIVMESDLPLTETIEIARADRDTLRGSRSRIPFGGVFTRQDLLLAALGASDNRAAAALARTYPGGTPAFVAAMNAKAAALGMHKTHFADASGLNRENVSTARDLVLLARAVESYPLLRTLSTTQRFFLHNRATGRYVNFLNTNRFVRSGAWDIGLSKTGYTTDAGNCLVMQTSINDRPVTVVLLNSWGKLSKYADAIRIRNWLIKTEQRISRTQLART